MDFLRGKAVLIIGILFAAISTAGLYYYLNNRESVVVAETPVPVASTTIPVVLAKGGLMMGHKLTEKDVKVVSWPKEIVKDFHFTSKKEIVGRILNSDIIEDEPITSNKVLPDGENISDMIPAGMRGVTVSLRRSEILLNVLQRGSYVDVLAVLDGRNEEQPIPGIDRNTRVISYAAKVLNISDLADNKNNNRNMEVVLLVKSFDAERIVSAMSNGVIELIVRNKNEPVLEVF